MPRARGALLAVALVLCADGAWAQLPEGPGKGETGKLCKKCHELAKSVSVRQDRAAWEATMNKMVVLGVQGTDQELSTILEYLVRNFPADEVPPINVNQATAIELESGLTLRRSEAAAIIRYRKENGNFKSIADLKKVPGVDTAKIEAKKQRLVF